MPWRQGAGVAKTKLAQEMEAYQVLLEGHRMDPDNEELYQDMLKAKAALEVAWLERSHQKESHQP